VDNQKVKRGRILISGLDCEAIQDS